MLEKSPSGSNAFASMVFSGTYIRTYIHTYIHTPERGRIKGQTISSLAGPWPREGAYQRPPIYSYHILCFGPRGGVSKVKPYIR
jgi:hypothetical protein